MIDLTALAKELLEKGTVTITISISVGQPVKEHSSANAVQMVEDGQFSVFCERCGKRFTHSTAGAAGRAIRSHRYHCQKKSPKRSKSILEQIEEMHSNNGAFRKE